MRLFLILFPLLWVVGCGRSETTVVDANGNKATVSADGTKVSVTDDKGNKMTGETGKGGDSVSVHDEKGDSKMESGSAVSEAELGLPFYPGSVEKKEGSIKIDTPETLSILSARTTTDEPGKVIAFYKPKVKEPNTSTTNSGGIETAVLIGKSDTGADVSISANREKGKSETQIS